MSASVTAPDGRQVFVYTSKRNDDEMGPMFENGHLAEIEVEDDLGIDRRKLPFRANPNIDYSHFGFTLVNHHWVDSNDKSRIAHLESLSFNPLYAVQSAGRNIWAWVSDLFS